VEASYKLSTQEQRVILFLVSLIKPEDEDFEDYSISIKEFADLVGVHHKGNYRDVKEITKKLIGKVFTIQSQDEELQISWLSSANYISGKGLVTLSFDRKLKPFLLQLKNRFTNYRLHQIMQLKSSFSIRIYELLKQYQKIGVRVFDIENLREKLGIEKEQYKNYNDFKRYVILVAQEELAAKTDISFKFEEIKVGRGVGKIRFFVKVKPQDVPQLTEPGIIPVLPVYQEDKPPESEDLLRLISLLPSDYQEKESIKKILKDWLKKQDFDYVARNIECANDSSNAINPGANLAKGSNYRNYLTKALIGDYGLSHKEDKETKRKANELARQKAQKETIVQNQLLEQSKNEKENQDRVKIFQQSLTPDGLEQLKAEAFSRMDPLQQEMLNRKTVGSEMLLKIMMGKISLERMKNS
jgi:hypothetical protein